jgi:hypothetical protein
LKDSGVGRWARTPHLAGELRPAERLHLGEFGVTPSLLPPTHDIGLSAAYHEYRIIRLPHFQFRQLSQRPSGRMFPIGMKPAKWIIELTDRGVVK